MWTSERSRRLFQTEAAAELGAVTLGGGPAGVSLGGERRWLSLCCPGGYTWRPAAGDRVVVLKAGAEMESPCVLGVLGSGEELSPGEVRLTSGNSRLSLKGEGLSLQGQSVRVNGVELEAYIRSVVSEMLGG